MFSLKEKIRYGAASLGDTAVYNLLVIYALFFMTDIAGVETLAAGHIIFISTIWNAFSIGLIGYLSDRFSFAGGRRLPYMSFDYANVCCTGDDVYRCKRQRPVCRHLLYGCNVPADDSPLLFYDSL